MKSRLRGIAILMTVALTATACGGADTEPAAPEPVETVEEAPAEQAPVEEVKEEEVPEELEWEEPDNVAEAQFTDDFDEVTDYSEYLEDSTVKSGSRIWILGKVEEYLKDSNSLKVSTKGGEWLVSVGTSGTDDYYKLVEKAVGKYVRIFGVYTGYDKDAQLPSMAFQTKEYSKYAYRLETVDNNFRLTQIDYTVTMPEFDQDETFRQIAYKIPSTWKKDDSESGHYYRYPEDTLSSFVMYNYIENPTGGFEEIDPDKILSELADSYAGEDDAVLRKQPFKLAGYPALCFEMAFTPDGFPIPLTMFCYMFIVENEYYFYGATEPFLVGETSKQIMSGLLSDLKYVDSAGDASKKAEAEKKTETETAKDTEKCKDTETAAAKETEPAPAPAPAESPKPAYPPKSEIQGKVFTQHLKGSLTGEKDGEMVTIEQEDDLPVFIFTDDMLANYSEETGTCSYSDQVEPGVPVTLTFHFSYDSSGNISYTVDTFSYTTSQYTATGSMSGHMQN